MRDKDIVLHNKDGNREETIFLMEWYVSEISTKGWRQYSLLKGFFGSYMGTQESSNTIVKDLI